MKPFRVSASPRVLYSALIGVGVFLAVQFFGLRAIVSPWWFVALVAVVVVLVDHDDAPTSVLMLVSCIVGVLPIAGFLGLPPEMSTLGVVLGGYAMVKTLDVSRRPASISLRGVATVSPALAGGVFTFWWWSELIKGSTTDVLTRLMTQWDLSTHFLFFSSVARDGRYLLLSSPPSDGYVWAGREYPAGIHYVWSQFGLALHETSKTDRSVLVPFFAQAIVITGAIAVVVVGLGFSRLGRTTLTRCWSGIIGTSLATALFCAGPMSASFWNGFANASTVVIGLSLLITFLVKPRDEMGTQLWVLAMGVAALALNWYPTIALFAPVLIVVGLKILAMRRRDLAVVFAFLVALSAAPLLWLLRSIGLARIAESTGGVNRFPDTILIGGAILALGLSILLFRKLRAETALLLATPAVLLYVLGRYMITSVGDLRYYFHKLGLFVGTYLLVLITGLLILHLQNALLPALSSLKTRIRGTVGVIVVAAAFIQMFGYWGPGVKGLNPETVGPIQRSRIMNAETKASDFLPLSAIVLREAAINRSRAFPEKSCMMLVLPKDVATDAAEDEFGLMFGLGDPANSLWLANIWFHSLSDSATTESIARTPRTTELGRVFDDYPPLLESRIDETIEETFSPSEVCILSTPEINSELRKKSDAWRTYDISS